MRRGGSSSRVGAWWSVAIPGLVTALLSGVVAVRTPLWRDEVASFSFASLPMGDLSKALTHVDAVLGAYYVLAHATVALSPDSFLLRLPSVLAITVATVAIAEVARRWWGSLPALVAGLSVSLNPLAIQQGATARPYALATCCVALATLCLVVALSRTPDATTAARLWPWVGYTVFLTLASYFHFFAVLTSCAFVVLAISARKFVVWLGCTAIAVLATVPLILAAYSQRGQVNWIPRPTLRSGIGSLASILTYRMDSGFHTFEAIALLCVALVAAVAAGLVLREGATGRTRDLPRLLFALVLSTGPWVLLLAVSLAATPYLRTTYLTPSVLGYALLMAALAAQLPAPWPKTLRPRLAVVALVVILLAPLAVGAIATWSVVTRPWYIDNYPGLAAELAQRVEPGDSLAVVQLYNEVGVAGGVARSTGDTGYFSELERLLVDGAQPRHGLRRVVSTDPLRTVPAEQVEPGSRLWVIYTRGALDGDELSDVGAREFGCGAQPQAVGSYGILRLAVASCPD